MSINNQFKIRNKSVRMSKSLLPLYCTILCIASVLLLVGCQSKNPPSEISPDSSRKLYFSEVHALTNDPAAFLCDVTVQKVFDSIFLYGERRCLLVQGSINHTFFLSEDFVAAKSGVGTDTLIWLDIERFQTDETEQAIRILLDESDSIIVYGYMLYELIPSESQNGQSWITESDREIESTFIDGNNILVMPPCVYVSELTFWPIMPIIDGKFNAQHLEKILLDSGIEEMAFDMYTEFAAGGQYFKSGDSKEDMYAALEQYVYNYEEIIK